jgi:hypothetical protein
VLAGPAAWTVQLLVSYVLVAAECALGNAWLLHGVTVGTGAAIRVYIILEGLPPMLRGPCA